MRGWRSVAVSERNASDTVVRNGEAGRSSYGARYASPFVEEHWSLELFRSGAGVTRSSNNERNYAAGRSVKGNCGTIPPRKCALARYSAMQVNSPAIEISCTAHFSHRWPNTALSTVISDLQYCRCLRYIGNEITIEREKGSLRDRIEKGCSVRTFDGSIW